MSEPSSPGTRAEPPAAPAESLAGRVLLADDGPDNQLLVSMILRRAGHDVTVVPDGRQARDVALAAWRQGEPFDVVLMDMEMPVLDGYRATKALREAGYRGLVIALTGHTDAGDRAVCLAAGCDDHIGKPVLRVPLLERMQQWLAQVRLAPATGTP